MHSYQIPGFLEIDDSMVVATGNYWVPQDHKTELLYTAQPGASNSRAWQLYLSDPFGTVLHLLVAPPELLLLPSIYL